MCFVNRISEVRRAKWDLNNPRDQWWGRKPFYLYVIHLNWAQVNTEQKFLMSTWGLKKMNPNWLWKGTS